MINQNVQKLAIRIRPIQIKLELILLTFLVVGLILKDSEIGFLLTLIPLQILAILYFMMAFRLEDPKKRILTFINKLTNLSFSVGTLGILFAIHHYPYSAIMLRIGLLTMVLGLFGLIVLKLRESKSKKIIDSDIIRTLIFSITIASLMTLGNLSDINKTKDDNNIENQTNIKK